MRECTRPYCGGAIVDNDPAHPHGYCASCGYVPAPVPPVTVADLTVLLVRLAARVHTVRTSLGMSLRECARNMGIGAATLLKVEDGDTHLNVDTIRVVLEWLEARRG